MLDATLTLLLLLAQSSSPSPSVAPATKQEDIVVTGTKPKERGRVEEPYSTTPRVVTGSRIARTPGGRRVFNTVATDTGLAGLMPTDTNNIDATGGSVPAFRKKRVRECKADQVAVSEAAACALFDIDRAIRVGDHEAAAAKLRTLQAGTFEATERYYVAFYAYRLAEARGDNAARETALGSMLASGKMPDVEQPQARRTLVAMALKRGDDRAAIKGLEQLVQFDPADARSHANLAALYERSGSPNKARTQMAAAIAAVRSTGAMPPDEWTRYLSNQAR